MSARDDEVQALVERLSAELGRSVLVDDPSLRVLAYTASLGSDDDVRRAAILTRETPRAVRELHFAQGIAKATAPVRTAPRPEYGLASRVCAPIRCQGTLFGYLWLIDDDRSLTDEQCELAAACADEIGAALYRQHELEQPRREQGRRLLEALLAGDEQATHELLADDLLVGGPIGVLALRPAAEFDAAEKARVSLALDRLRRVLAPRHALSVVQAEQAVLLVVLDARTGLPELARRAHESLPDVALGYSEAWPRLADAPRAFAQARLAARVALSEGSPAGWEDLGALRMLARLADMPHPEELLHPGIPRLLSEQEALVATLEAYLDNGCDTKLTAEALYLHRASLYYRLQRIEQVTGTSLKDGADRLALHASLKLARLLGLHPARRGRDAAA
jgi:PucR C-terminal helix-turn-helix domain/GGDEF-like domain/GAF domain